MKEFCYPSPVLIWELHKTGGVWLLEDRLPPWLGAGRGSLAVASVPGPMLHLGFVGRPHSWEHQLTLALIT